MWTEWEGLGETLTDLAAKEGWKTVMKGLGKVWVWIGRRARGRLANKEEVAHLTNWARNPG